VVVVWLVWLVAQVPGVRRGREWWVLGAVWGGGAGFRG
jgi:hypothetical protein